MRRQHYLLLINLCTVFALQGQAKFFTLRDARLALGYHLSYNIPIVKAQLSNEKLIARNKNYNHFYGKLGNASGGVVFDLFTPNSRVGLQSGVYYVRRSTSIDSWQNLDEDDDFLSHQLEFPILLKLRSGSDEDQRHFVWTLGPSYARSLRFTHYTFDGELINDLGYTRKDFWSLHSSFGLETVIAADRKRILFAVNINYPFSDLIDSSFSNADTGIDLNGLSIQHRYLSLTLTYTSFGRTNSYL